MKKNMKLKIIVSSIILLGLSNQSYAAWAVIDAANLKQTTIIAKNTFTIAQQIAATGQKVSQVNESINALHKQTVLNTEDQDIRYRKALGDAAQGGRMMDMIPTLKQCAEITKGLSGGARSSAVASSNLKATGGSYGRDARAKNVTSSAAALGQVLNGKYSLGTCHEEIFGAANCATKGEYARGDTEPRSIKGNIKGLNNSDNNEAEFNNYTFTEKSDLDVAQKYVSDSTMYDKPKVVDKETLKKNPAYAALYENMMTKLNAANDALTDILKMRRPSSVDIQNSLAGKEWNDISGAKYKKVTGLAKKPTNPSMFDLVNYHVLNDYLGNEDAELDSTEEVNKRLALNNYILWAQYRQQENTNILLSHILVQLTTPITKEQVDAEFVKTMSHKK